MSELTDIIDREKIRDRLVRLSRGVDRRERRAADWRVSDRKLLCDWQNDLGAAADWSQGLFGAPFVSEHPVGLASGDHSESFLRSAHQRADSS